MVKSDKSTVNPISDLKMKKSEVSYRLSQHNWTSFQNSENFSTFSLSHPL